MKILISGKEIELKDEDVTKAIEDKTTLDLKNDFILRTVEEERLFTDNNRKDGVKAGAEIGRKEILNALNLEVDGIHKSEEKTIDSINSFVAEKTKEALIDAKIEPNKKIEAFEKDIKTLQNTITDVTKEKENALNNFTTFKNQMILKNKLFDSLPDNLILPKTDMVVLLNTKIKTDVSENGNVIGLDSDGNIIKDTTTLAPKPIKELIDSFFNKNPQYLKQASGGAGGGDSIAKGDGSQYDSFVKEMESAGYNEGSEEFNLEVQKRISNKTLQV